MTRRVSTRFTPSCGGFFLFFCFIITTFVAPPPRVLHGGGLFFFFFYSCCPAPLRFSWGGFIFPFSLPRPLRWFYFFTYFIIDHQPRTNISLGGCERLFERQLYFIPVLVSSGLPCRVIVGGSKGFSEARSFLASAHSSCGQLEAWSWHYRWRNGSGKLGVEGKDNTFYHGRLIGLSSRLSS